MMSPGRRSTIIVSILVIVLAAALRPKVSPRTNSVQRLAVRRMGSEIAGATLMSILIGSLVTFQMALPAGTDVEGRVARILPTELSSVVRESKLAWQTFTAFEIVVGFIGLAIESSKRKDGLSFFSSVKELAQQYKAGRKHQLTDTCSVYFHSGRNGNRTLVFAPGGAWAHGDDARIWAILAQRIINRIGSNVLIIEYSGYPSASGATMISDVLTALRFVHSRYGGQDKTLLLCGHSAGAHLIATALLSADHEDEALADGALLLSGPYDLEKHLQHEQERGVAHVSVLETAFSADERSGSASPSFLARQKGDKALLSIGLRKIIIAHGDSDPIVPISATHRFVQALSVDSSSEDIDLRILPNTSHLDYILEAFLPPPTSMHRTADNSSNAVAHPGEQDIFFRLIQDLFDMVSRDKFT